MIMEPDRVIESDALLGWRVAICQDEEGTQPFGDALAPALLVDGHACSLAREVYRPREASRIEEAWRHFSSETLFARYVRMFHGAKNVISVGGDRATVIIFDTADFRDHVGSPSCDLDGEATEWRAWLDGEIYGAQLQKWDAAAQQWIEDHSVWGLYGQSEASAKAREMLTQLRHERGMIMDPNSTLEDLRSAIRSLRNAAEGDSNDAEIEAGHAVADAAEALDEWLSKGGFPPSAWRSLGGQSATV